MNPVWVSIDISNYDSAKLMPHVWWFCVVLYLSRRRTRNKNHLFPIAFSGVWSSPSWIEFLSFSANGSVILYVFWTNYMIQGTNHAFAPSALCFPKSSKNFSSLRKFCTSVKRRWFLASLATPLRLLMVSEHNRYFCFLWNLLSRLMYILLLFSVLVLCILL